MASRNNNKKTSGKVTTPRQTPNISIGGREYIWDDSVDGAVCASLHPIQPDNTRGGKVSVIWDHGPDSTGPRYTLNPYTGPVVPGESVAALKEQAASIEADRIQEAAAVQT